MFPKIWKCVVHYFFVKKYWFDLCYFRAVTFPVRAIQQHRTLISAVDFFSHSCVCSVLVFFVLLSLNNFPFDEKKVKKKKNESKTVVCSIFKWDSNFTQFQWCIFDALICMNIFCIQIWILLWNWSNAWVSDCVCHISQRRSVLISIILFVLLFCTFLLLLLLLLSFIRFNKSS